MGIVFLVGCKEDKLNLLLDSKEVMENNSKENKIATRLHKAWKDAQK